MSKVSKNGKSKVTFELNDEKLSALRHYVTERGDVTSVEELLQSVVETAFDKSYKKYVPKQVREYIEMHKDN